MASVTRKTAGPQAEPVADINNRFFFRFFQAANLLHTKGTQALDEFAVTTQQWSVLGALSRPQAGQGMSIGELSRYLMVSRQNLTGLLSRLERDGHIERVVCAADKRARRVALSPAGIKLWRALAAPIQQFYEEALAGISVEQRQDLVQLVSALQKNMARL
jgi:MarR family transcriptional regulator, organic hydroperoxide resistance regulator